MVGSRVEPRAPPTSEQEQPYKWETHCTLAQNLKTMILWVISLIKCSTSTFLSSHLHTTMYSYIFSKYKNLSNTNKIHLINKMTIIFSCNESENILYILQYLYYSVYEFRFYFSFINTSYHGIKNLTDD